MEAASRFFRYNLEYGYKCVIRRREARKGEAKIVKGYFLAKTEDEVLALLKQHAGDARLVAGGTDLLLDLQSGKVNAAYLVDITRVAALCEISEAGGALRIGAAARHNELAESALVREHAAALAAASAAVGSYQIRNRSTVGGNVVNAQPAADSAVALAALDARATLLDAEGSRELPLLELYAGVGKSVVDSGRTLLAYFTIRKREPGQGSAFVRLQQRKALALPMLNVAAFLAVAENKVTEARIVMAPVGPGPVRAKQAEEFLVGKAPLAAHFNAAAKLALEDAAPRDSIVRGSKEYRTGVLPSLVVKALDGAYADSKNAQRR